MKLSMVLTLVFAVAVAATVAGSARASRLGSAAHDFDIEFALGFSNTFRLGRWTPLNITIRNRGPMLDGTLQVVIPYGEEFLGEQGRTVFSAPLELASGARKRIEYVVPIETFSRPLTLLVRDGSGVVVSSREMRLKQHFTEARIVLALGPGLDLDVLNESNPQGVRVLYPHSQRLPSRWQGYDGVDLVVLRAMSLESLSSRQYQALTNWLAQGGSLVVSADPDTAYARTPRLADLLPAAVTGVGAVSQPEEVRVALGLPEPTWIAKPPFDVHLLQKRGGEILVPWNGSALVAKRTFGRGRVVQLAIDVARPPFAHSAQLHDFWQKLLDSGASRLQPEEVAVQLSLDPRAAVSPILRFLSSEAERAPHHGLLGGLLVMYIGVVFVGYYTLDVTRMSWWKSAAATWGAPLLAVAVMWGVLSLVTSPAGSRMVALTTIEPLGDSARSLLRLDVGLYSNEPVPMGFGYDIAHPAFLPSLGVRAEGKVSSWTFRQSAAPRISPQGQGPFILHVLQGTSMTPFPFSAYLASSSGSEAKTDAKAEIGAGGIPPRTLSVVVDNATGDAVSNLGLLHGGRWQPLGTAEALARAQWPLAGEGADFGPDALRTLFAEPGGRRARAALEFVYEQLRERLSESEAPAAWLVGRLPARLDGLRTEGLARVERHVFLIMPVQLRQG